VADAHAPGDINHVGVWGEGISARCAKYDTACHRICRIVMAARRTINGVTAAARNTSLKPKKLRNEPGVIEQLDLAPRVGPREARRAFSRQADLRQGVSC
jgi:hypothetical protein